MGSAASIVALDRLRDREKKVFFQPRFFTSLEEGGVAQRRAALGVRWISHTAVPFLLSIPRIFSSLEESGATIRSVALVVLAVFHTAVPRLLSALINGTC